MPQEFSRFTRLLTTLAGVLVLAGCGGGGGNGGNPNPPPDPNPPATQPTVALSVNPTSIASGQTVTVTWASTNATSCTASGGWSGTKNTSGSETSAALTATTTFSLSCTGAGGSASASATATVVPPPTVTLAAAQAVVTVNYSTTLTWSSTDATECSASDGWTGTKPASGSEATPPITAPTTFTLTCTGAGGSSTPQQVSIGVTPPPAGQVVLSGKITFDRLPFGTQGLNGSAPVRSNAREVVVEILGAVSASTVTDTNGYYAVTVPASVNVSVRARAQMQRTGSAPTWNFRVLNNTNSGALYVLQGTSFNTGTANVTHDLHAASGWSGSTYSGARSAAPFAILDTVYNAKQLILSAVPAAQFPDLNLYWSTQNRTNSDPFCPDTGDIGTSFYFNDPSGLSTDDCATPQPLPGGIYILGDYGSGAGDTDEFDAHVVAHEFGHYFEDRFSRSDSIGGEHNANDRLDLRVAFGEGWGNAFGAMSLGDPQYRDSFSGISDDFGFNLETGSNTTAGWFSEASVGEVLWDIFDNGTSEASDSVALGFAPIYAVMSGEQVDTDAFTSIFSFADALQSNNPGTSSAIETLLDREDIEANDEFGAGESNTGSDPQAIPVYQDITLNAPLSGVCTNTLAGSTDLNKLGNRRFLRFVNNTSRMVTISAIGSTSGLGTIVAEDPDILVFRQGQLVAVGESADPNREDIPQAQLAAGTHIIEVYDFELTGTAPRCMTVSITGN